MGAGDGSGGLSVWRQRGSSLELGTGSRKQRCRCSVTLTIRTTRCLWSSRFSPLVLRVPFVGNRDVSASAPSLLIPELPRHQGLEWTPRHHRSLELRSYSSQALVVLELGVKLSLYNMSRRDDDLAYGDYHGQGDGEEGDRGMIGDMGRRFFGGKKEVCAFHRPQCCHRYTECMMRRFKVARGVMEPD